MIQLFLQILFIYLSIGLIISFLVDLIFYTKKETGAHLVGFGQHIFFVLIWPYFIYCLIKELI